MELAIADVAVRLVAAAVFAGAVGFEREASRKAAGLRTHMLIGLGAALFAVLSIEGFDAPDQSRIAAQVVTGVGFLGAGAIFRHGTSIRGLTTAAGMWAVAAIGLAAGAGELSLAVTGTVVALLVLLGLRTSERWAARKFGSPLVTIEAVMARPATLSSVWKIATRSDEDSQGLSFREDNQRWVARFGVHGEKAETVASLLSVVDGVISVEILEKGNP